MTLGLVDNDVLHKAAAYGVIPMLLDSVPLSIKQYGMLGAAKHIVRKKLQKRPPQRGSEVAVAQFEIGVARINEIEPTEEEVRFAAQLELQAQQLNAELDAGESLLCAVLTRRGEGYVFTGDKRAIGAAQLLLENNRQLPLKYRLVCLEQMFLWLLNTEGFAVVRAAVCPEPDVDRALSNCFSCRSSNASEGSCMEGLASYIASLRASAPAVLLPEC